MLDNYEIPYTKVIGASNTFFTVKLPCSVTSLVSQVTELGGATSSFTLTNSVVGVCSTTCYNCIEDSNLPKMYEVLHKLLS